MFAVIDCLEREICTSWIQIDRHQVFHTGKLSPTLPEFFVNLRTEQLHSLGKGKIVFVVIEVVEKGSESHLGYDVTIEVVDESSHHSLGYCVEYQSF